MPYTDLTLATFMATKLSRPGVSLGLTNTSATIVEAVADVVALLGPIADQTDDLKTRTIAEWRAWIAAEAASTDDKDLKAGSSSIDLQDRFENIQKALARAEVAASRYSEAADVIYGSGGTAYVSGVSTSGSPYAYPCPGGW